MEICRYVILLSFFNDNNYDDASLPGANEKKKS